MTIIDDMTALRLFEAMHRAGWTIDAEHRVWSEKGELVTDSLAEELELLARFFGVARVADA